MVKFKESVKLCPDLESLESQLIIYCSEITLSERPGCHERLVIWEAECCNI